MFDKPRLIRLRGKWVVAEHFCRWPNTGAIMFYPAGEGETTKQAWNAAYPPSFLARFINRFRGTA